MVKRLSVIGSTGTIGQKTLDIVRNNPDRFEVVGLAAGHNIELLKKQICEFSPRVVSVIGEDDRRVLKRCISPKIECLCGEDGAAGIASFPDANLVLSAIVGAAGLKPTLSAISAGKDLALANKESLVVAGRIVMDEVRKRGVTVIPVDSEHSAILQAITGQNKKDIKGLILTASGGPFLYTDIAKLKDVTPEEALAHPTWNMGKRITVDSATLMNKGLEVIEARWLFNVQQDRISVCIHPQSVIHSMVEYVDGSIIAQMSVADMRIPIAYALSFPERIDSGATPLKLCQLESLEFMTPDTDRFPSLKLAYDALEEGGTMTAVLNAADEIAIEAFLKRDISFVQIPEVIDSVMQLHETCKAINIEDVLDADRWARGMAVEMIRKMH